MKKHINILDFIKTGKFANIEVGQTMEFISANFPPPDDIWNDANGISIWRHGSIEFHFFDDELITIWCDWLEYIGDTKKISLDVWLLNRLDELTLPYICSEFEKLGINYTQKETRYSETLLPDNIILNIADTNVVMYFEDKKELKTSINNYYLIAIGATNSNR